MSTMSFSVELKNFRKAQKLTQKQLAEKFGVSQMSILQWENGHSIPGLANLQKVQKIMAETPVASTTPAPTVAPEAKVAKKRTKKVKAPKAPKAAKKAKTTKAPKAPKAPKAEKVTSKKAPWGSKVHEEIASLKATIAALEKKLEAHISSVPAPSIPIGSKEAPAVKASDQKTVGDPDTDSLLREMCLSLRRSRVDAEVRGKTKHVVEWPDVCNVYKRSLEVLHMEDK